MQFLRFEEKGRQMVVKIVGGIGKSGKDQHLSIPLIDGRGQLAENGGLEMLELCVVRRSDFVHLSQQSFDDGQVGAQLVFPAWQIHVGKIDLHLVANPLIIGFWKIAFLSRS